jgi:bacillithiol system protein YtxJ
MTYPFLPLTDVAAFDAALDRSRDQPILIFKHSATCGISAHAQHELGDWYERQGAPVPIFVIHVRRHRDVSDAVAARFAIRHESPQMLLVDNGVVRWHGSHWHVNGREVQEALDALATIATR